MTSNNGEWLKRHRVSSKAGSSGYYTWYWNLLLKPEVTKYKVQLLMCDCITGISSLGKPQVCTKFNNPAELIWGLIQALMCEWQVSFVIPVLSHWVFRASNIEKQRATFPSTLSWIWGHSYIVGKIKWLHYTTRDFQCIFNTTKTEIFSSPSILNFRWKGRGLFCL